MTSERIESSGSSRTSGLTLLISMLALALAAVALLQNAFVESDRSDSIVEGSASDGAGPARVATGRPSRATDPNASQSTEATETTVSQSEIKPQHTIWLPEETVPATKDELESEAEFVAEQLMTRLPSQSAALHVNALLAAQLHRTEEAEKLWRQCIELEPSVDQYYVNLAAIAMDRGDDELAIDTLQQALERDLQSADLVHHLGVALTNVGRTAEALEVIRQALSIQPSAAPFWLILGQAQLKIGETEEAEESLRRAISLGANTKPAYFALFNACMRNGKRDEAMKFREIYLGFENDDSLAAEERYQVLSESEARRVASSVMLETAILYAAAGLPRDAEHLLLRVLALDPENKQALLELDKIFDSEDRAADQRMVLKRLTQVDRLDLLNYLRLAKTEIACGNPAAAEAAIKHAIALSPQTVTGYAAMTDFLLEENQPEKAEWYIAYALKLEPSQIGYQLLAKTLRAQGRERDAQQAEAAGEDLAP